MSDNDYGLALAIAERVIAAVNGRIRAKNSDSGGPVVEIELVA
jgi:C4-dicarboxylate-specific signal transduction histidine kinase